MDYEKKYKEALERAKEKYPTCYSPALLEYIFPELKESEGERIRKELLEHCKNQAKPYIQTGNKCPQIQSWIAWLEKQSNKPQGKTALEPIKEEKVDNQTCMKPADKFKPKFKVGDWISNDMCDVHIASIENGMYYFDEGDGLSIVFVDEHYHIWTIEDAMDGDVLVSRSPFIYGKQCPYGGLNWCNNKFIKASNFIFTDSPVHPATKEQRDFLFQKMKEAGYEWDINKKELRKKE